MAIAGAALGSFFAMAGAGLGAIDCCSGFILVAVGLTTVVGKKIKKSKKVSAFSLPPPEALHWDP